MIGYAELADPRCGNCKHFRPIAANQQDPDGDYSFALPIEDGEYGKCTRYPPRFFYPKLLNAEFPVVSHLEHCGEHAPETQ